MNGNKVSIEKIFLVLFCIFGLFSHDPLYGGKGPEKNGTFHLIIVADTRDREIGESDKKDVLNLVKEVKKIAYYSGINYAPYILYHDKASYAHLSRIITQLKVSANDTIFFLYSGHGYRTKDKGSNSWPNLYLSDQGVDFSIIVERLLKKTPRLLIAISDSCNSIVDEDEDGYGLFIPAKEKAEEEFLRALIGHKSKPSNYKQLFYYSKGLIMASASVPGDIAIGLPTSGGYYTTAFLKSLDEETSFERTSWNIIMQKAEDKTNLLNQYPQWIYLEDVSNIDATLKLIGR